MIREKAGFSVANLARAVRVSEGAIRQLESGDSKFPTFPVGVRLASVLNVTTAYLLNGRGGRLSENESRSLASVVMEQERQDMQIVALGRRVSRLEDRARGATGRKARE